MSSTFTGFSEEDLKRIKSVDTESNIESKVTTNIKKAQIGAKHKRTNNQYKLPLQKQSSDEAIDVMFDKCRLSIKNKPITEYNNNDSSDLDNISTSTIDLNNEDDASGGEANDNEKDSETVMENHIDSRKSSTGVTPDLVRSVDNYTEDELASHGAKLEELQLKQKIMEEQNKKRKEMLAKALADRTKQTAEEVVRLEKIKKELQVLDGQFSQDVSVLRKKIDQACLSYAEAEKHYLKIEKEFLQAKINLQKEKEKKELLTEHLCALITHNETRKAQKLETLMLELASDRKGSLIDRKESVSDLNLSQTPEDDDSAIIVDGVCEKTGKMVEL
ncbi:RAB6-interacting golgin [Leguminivora glycinivorella]|uniref:RAB6-interacting golgin n=1 Tax=Leguminivora glycinivorella TaxID=1035111 RepID=UPI00200EBA44|nr:RAB6-interacting golgin [Leguminivora glycinivorella]